MHSTYSSYHHETPLLVNQEDKRIRVYWSRWYILLLYSILSLHQSNIWITFGTVPTQTCEYYQLGNNDSCNGWVNLFTLISCFIFIPTTLLSSYLLDVHGIRLTIIVAAIMDFVATWIRVIADRPERFWIIVVAQVINSMVGPLVMCGCPKLSSVWFPVEERTTATSISVMFNNVGTAVAFLMAPALVVNVSDLMKLFYVDAGISSFLLVCALLYCPNEPPTPPSFSQMQSRDLYDPSESFLQYAVESWRSVEFVARECFSRPSLLWTIASYSISQGANSGYTAMFTLILGPVGFTDTESGWLGAASVLFGAITGILVGRVADKIPRYKLLVNIIYALSILFTTWFVLIIPPQSGYIPALPHSFGWVFAICSMSGIFISASAPLFYEICIELTFPKLKEGMVTALMTNWFNLITGIFLIVGSYIPVNTMNFVMIGTLIFSFLCMLFVNEDYERMKMDRL